MSNPLPRYRVLLGGHVDPQDFENQLNELARKGYRVLATHQLREGWSVFMERKPR